MKVDDGQRRPSVNLENDWSGVNKNFNIDRRGAANGDLHNDGKVPAGPALACVDNSGHSHACGEFAWTSWA